MIGVRLRERVMLERSEPSGESDLLVGRELLLAEEDHQVVVQRAFDARHGLGIIRCRREVDPADLGTDRRGERYDIERGHGGSNR